MDELVIINPAYSERGVVQRWDCERQDRADLTAGERNHPSYELNMKH